MRSDIVIMNINKFLNGDTKLFWYDNEADKIGVF